MSGRIGQAEIENALRLLEQGRLDDIAPEMMDELERLLNASPEAVGRLEHCSMAADVAMPLPEVDVSEEAWEAAWRRIESQADGTQEVVGFSEDPHEPAVDRSAVRPIWTRWGARLSLAAAIGLAVTASLVFSNREATVGMALAGPGDALIESVEVFDDSMSYILSAVDGDDVSIVWIMEETS